jgi:uncharacterized integral membrane protein (TIGR00698 family)
LPVASPAIALSIGLVFSAIGMRSSKLNKHKTTALQASIVLMGFGMNLTQVISASKTGFMITAVSVIVTISLGLLLGKLFKVESKTSLLIASGTAICGGSAIAAVSSVINAKDYQISFSLAVIFILNSIALFIFPPIGHYFELSQKIFGYWAAIAIHDTSSVVGAGATYGAQALEIATVVKLTRALWIIPLSIIIALFNKEKGKVKIPWFIGLFVVSIIFAHIIPQWQVTYTHLQWLGKKGMVIALFLIGSNISVSEAKKAGARSFIMGILLWITVASSALFLLTSKF